MSVPLFPEEEGVDYLVLLLRDNYNWMDSCCKKKLLLLREVRLLETQPGQANNYSNCAMQVVSGSFRCAGMLSFLLLLLCCCGGVGGECVHLEESLWDQVDQKCLPLLLDQGQEVYLPTGVSWEALEAQVYPYTSALGVWVSEECREAGLKLACHFIYKTCSNDSQPISPCLSLCMAAHNSCRVDLEGSGKTIPPCVTTLFPNSSCNIGSDEKVAYSQADCPYPTEFHASESEALDPEDPTSLCMYPCPGPVYTEEEWDAMFIVINVFSSISLVLSVFYVVTAVLNPDTRQFPANLVPLLCAASIPVTLGMMLGLFAGGMRNVLCSDGEYQAVGQGDAGGLACVLQGMLIVFGGLWAGSLWPIVGINLVLMVVVKIKQETLAKLKHLYHLIFWSIPTVMTIIPLAAKKISASPTLPWCFVYDKDSDWWTYGCFHILFILTWIVGSVSLVIVLVSICLRTYKFNLQGNMPLQQFIRILVLLGIYWLMGASIMVYRFYGSAIKEKVQNSIEDQIYCSAYTGTECELEEKPSYGMTLFNSIVMSSIGFCVFFAVGCSEKTFRYWQSLIRGLLHANGNEERLNVLRAHTQKREWTRRRTLSKTRRDQQGSKANHFGNSSSSTLGSEETASSSANLSMKELGDEEADGSGSSA
ncbi:hypothetical protein QOT17_001047 [Balamuthia mandrillaris]